MDLPFFLLWKKKLKKIFILFNPAVLTPCHGFSVDTEQPVVFRETVKSFGYSVVQFGSGANAG